MSQGPDGGLWQGCSGARSDTWPARQGTCLCFLCCRPIEGLCAPSNHPHPITDEKEYLVHLGICSLGNESDLELEKKYKDDDREKAPKRPRTQRAEKVQKAPLGKEAAQISGAKKPIISVVLTAHEAIPGDHSQRGSERGCILTAGPWPRAASSLTNSLSNFPSTREDSLCSVVRGERGLLPLPGPCHLSSCLVVVVGGVSFLCPQPQPLPGPAPSSSCPTLKLRPPPTRRVRTASQSLHLTFYFAFFSGVLISFIMLEISLSFSFHIN